MKRLLPFFIGIVLYGNAFAAPGPLRILFLGENEGATTKHCAAVMRGLGRDSIWFDYTSKPALVTPEWIAKFDAILLDAPKENFPALAAVDPARIVAAEFAGEARTWDDAPFLTPLRDKLVAAAGEARGNEWKAFVAQMEPEVRRPDPNVANYEKRPKPLDLQLPFNVKGSMERTQVPVDMKLELFAAEPDITKPIALAWDERGRLWVAETRDYPHNVKRSGEGNDVIRICEDTDGDGKADKFTVFADQLNIPTSLVIVNGGVIVAQPPRLLFLKDTDGDDKADGRQEIMTGWGIGDTHAQASSLHYGYDNWIHGCVGYSGFRGSVGGKRLEFGQGTYRFTRDGSALEFLHQFSNNSWGQSFNAAGDDFGGTANNAPIFFGGIPATIVPAGMRAMTAKKINVEDKVHTITPNFRQVDAMGGYTAAAGSAFMESGNLPPRLRGQALVCEPTMKVITIMEMAPGGAGWVAKDGFNLVASTDEWMSPVFAEVGPDGAVWFADWQNFIIQHNPTPSQARGGYNAKTGVGGAHENPLRDHSRGRIYRVVWEKAPAPAVKSLKDAAPAELVGALGDGVQERRLTAQRRLVETTAVDTAPALKQLVIADDGSVAALHALRTLQGLGQLDEATHKAALAAKDPALRRNAIRALAGDQRGSDLFFASEVISDADFHTRLAAMVKLAEFKTNPAIRTLVRKLIADQTVKNDEWLREAGRILEKKHEAMAYREGPNLLPNPGFEIVRSDNFPELWRRRDYNDRPGTAEAAWSLLNIAGAAHGGYRAMRAASRGEADTSFFAEVPLKPNTQYRLSAWIKTRGLRGSASLSDNIGRAQTERVTAADSGWTQVDTTFNSASRPIASINLLHVGRGESYYDDVKLCELILDDGAAEKALVGDARRGEEIFLKHPAAACVLCHMLKGQGSAVGPALDGIASRATPQYIMESILEPNKVLAKGYEALGVSPMPPMGTILKPQELEDLKAFMQTLK